jgi:hypothetical protein
MHLFIYPSLCGPAYTRWQRNFLTGTIPTEIGMLDSLAEFWLRQMDISGTIPSEIGLLGRTLRDIRLDYTSMTGTIPEEIYQLTFLNRLDLYDAGFNGTISTMVGQFTTLDYFRIRENEFSGVIPTELGLLTELRQVWLAGNNFRGEIPLELCAIRGPDLLQIITADCLASEFTGVPAVECPVGCCTLCCDADAGFCDA